MLKQDRGRKQIAESCNEILMSNKPIISVGGAALDYIYKICEFPPAPTKLQALKHITSGGGMAANAAATIAKLGGTIALWSRVGGDDERHHPSAAETSGCRHDACTSVCLRTIADRSGNCRPRRPTAGHK